jgi:uncharacterized phage protein gp47/JayE
MSFKIPTLSEVNRNVENGFSKAFYGSSGILRVMVLKVISKVVAGSMYLVVLLLSYIWKNSFVASAEVDGLVRIGSKRNFPPKPASRARGTVDVEGDVGVTIPAGTVVVDEQSGHEYEFIAECVIPYSLKTTAQVYSVEYGSEYNLPADTVLVFRDVAPGEASIKVSDEGLYGGNCVKVTVDGVERKWGETVEEYRQRLKVREQNQANGGSDTDYWLWAMKFSEVSDCWVIPNWPATNSVSIYVADFRSSAIAVNSVVLDEIREFICAKHRKPATSDVSVGTVDPMSVSLEIKIPVVNDYFKSAVVDTLKNFFRSYGPGQSFTVEDLQRYVISFSGVADCKVVTMNVDGNVVDYSVTLDKEYSGSAGAYEVTGKVIDVSSLDSSVVFSRLE